MNLSYRARKRLKQGLIIGAAVLLVLAFVWMLWILWLDRYVVYTRDGAKLDFSHSIKDMAGQSAGSAKPKDPVSIYFNEGENMLASGGEMKQMVGYYINAEMLSNEFDTVQAMVRKLPTGTPVMLDVKDATGKFIFSSGLGPNQPSVDAARVDEFIRNLCTSDLYVIARFSAFREYSFAIDNVNYGLASTRGAYLYMDEGRCYWLNPTSNGTLTFVMQQIAQLKELGFDEVVLGNFCFPNSTEFRFTGDKTEALMTTAKTLVDTYGSDYFTMSFEVTDEAFTLPEGRCRIYRTGCLAEEAKAVAERSTVDDTTVKLVFVTELLDTRFDPYSVLRPLTSARLD